MKDFWREPETQKINKKKIAIISLIVILVIAILSIVIVYFNNQMVREWIDKNIFRKEIIQNNATILELKEAQANNILAFNKNIGILNKNKLEIYSSSANKEKELDIQITNPIYNVNNRFLVIGEENGQKLYLIEDKEIIWETTIDGKISQVYVNKNGYVAISIVGTSHKTVIAMYSPKGKGKEMFKSYLSTTMAVDLSISNDNKYLAFAEVDTSGTVIQSNVKVMSVEKVEIDPTNSIDKIYKSETNKLLTNIQYQDKNKLVCMYTDGISIIENEKEQIIIDNTSKKSVFQSIKLNNSAILVEERSSGLFSADSVINIVNIENKNTKEYVVDSVTKEIKTSENVIALNTGTEIEFINTGGWLVKRYLAQQELTDIVLTDGLAGIIYRDRIEIINL